MSDPISFQAALSGANTAARCLTISADGDGKLVLEFSSSELANVLPILGLAGSTFTVTISKE